MGQMVFVKWFDAWQDSGAEGTPDEINEAILELNHVGFFLKVVDDYLVISNEVHGCGETGYRFLHYFPLVNLLEVSVLSVKE